MTAGARATGAALSAALRALAPALRSFEAATGCPVHVVRAGTGGADSEADALAAAALRGSTDRLASADGRRLAVRVGAGGAAPASAVLVLGPGPGDAPLDAYAAMIAGVVEAQLRAAAEGDQAARELAERYEEINLLYTISEILGRAVTIEETAATILAELSETVGAGRAAVLVHDRVTDTLQLVAALGVPPDAIAPVAAADPASLAARVFRDLHPVIAEAHDGDRAAGDGALHDGATLAVPIVWSTPAGGEPLGVVLLSARTGGQQFTAGDLKLVTAIASQIAAAVQNARLVRASLQQQRLAQEMALAHDLQMGLLPRPDVVAPEARVAARVVPAESVGGDFYHLFRLSGGRTGVMIGDVSGHGYRAALIMALAMSAAAIHAQDSGDPGRTLAAVLRSVGEELASTEMFISTCYAVVDPARGELHYANAGHPHAFVLGDDGRAERLPAGAPPLGMVAVAPEAGVRPWRPGRDQLFLFTDGVSDARDRAGRVLGEDAVLAAARAAAADDPETLVARAMAVLDAHTEGAPLRDDLTLLALRS